MLSGSTPGYDHDRRMYFVIAQKIQFNYMNVNMYYRQIHGSNDFSKQRET
jgi:hypothetical protein